MIKKPVTLKRLIWKNQALFLCLESLRARALKRFVRRRQLARAQLFDGNGHSAGHIANLRLHILVGIKRVVAGGIRLVIADEPVQPGLVACVYEPHPVEPVAQRAARTFNACHVAMHDHAVSAAAQVFGVVPTLELKRLGFQRSFAMCGGGVRVAAVGTSTPG
jgi:hypothetical protein